MADHFGPPHDSLPLAAGLTVVESELLTKDEWRHVSRSWRERLFTLPWCPMQKTKVVIVQVPSDQAIVFGNTLVCHPEFARAVRGGRM